MFDRWIRATALISIGCTALAGCVGGGGGTGANGVPLVTEDKLTVCVNTPHPPFQVKDDGGQVLGFDVDVMGLVAQKLDVTVSIVDTSFDGIKSGRALRTGKCDVAAAGLTADARQRKEMDFSDPYFDNPQVLVIRPGDTELIKDASGLKGKKVSVQGGTSGAAYAHRLEAEKGFEVVEYPDFGLQQYALTTKQVDASIADLAVWTDFNRQNPNQIAIIEEFDTGEKYAYAVRKGADAKLLETINDTLREAQSSGEYATIYAKWLGPKLAGD